MDVYFTFTKGPEAGNASEEEEYHGDAITNSRVKTQGSQQHIVLDLAVNAHRVVIVHAFVCIALDSQGSRSIQSGKVWGKKIVESE